MTKKNIITLSIILLLGIGTSIFAFASIQRNEQIAAETKSVAVLNKDIYPYETINGSDIKHIDIPMSANTEGYITEKLQLSGLVSTEYIVAGELVSDGSVVEKDLVKNINFVTLKTDYTRSGASKVGDVVNVYKYVPQVDTTPPQTILLAENAIVISITDVQGTSISTVSSTIVGDRKIPVQAIKLAIDTKRNNIKSLVEGSINGDNFALVVTNNVVDIK